MLVDVHAHLCHEKFNTDLDKVIDNSKKAGVRYIITSGVNPTSNRISLEQSRKYDIVKCSLGLYPIDLVSNKPDASGMPQLEEPFDIDKELEFIEKNKKDIIAIGEVGLDYHWDTEKHGLQIKNFEKIIDFVERIKKPIIIHSRKAEKDVIDILETSKLKKVILHSFMGNKKLIKRAEDLSYYFSVPPIIIRLQHFQTLVELVNVNQLLTETDCPWLSPFPNTRNEPAFIVEAIKKISEIKKLDKDEVIKNIFMNFQKIFLQN